MHICGVENVIVHHRTYFHESYMTGEAYFMQQDFVQSETLKFNLTNFNAFLDGLYAQPNFLSVGSIDTVLMSLFRFLQTFIKDDGDNLLCMFNGFPVVQDYWYNGKSYDDNEMIDLNKVNKSTMVAKHHAVLTSLYQSSSFKFNIILQKKDD